MLPVLLVLLVVAAGLVMVRARLAAAERARVDLEAFRAELGMPAGRFRVVDVGLVEGLVETLSGRRPPLFADVHRVERREGVGV